MKVCLVKERPDHYYNLLVTFHPTTGCTGTIHHLQIGGGEVIISDDSSLLPTDLELNIVRLE